MPDTFKLRVLKAMTAAFKEISPADGYQCDLSDFDPGDGVPVSRVYRGRAWFGENDPDTLVSVLEAPENAQMLGEPPASATAGECDWGLLVQGFVEDDPVNPTDSAYPLLADLRRRLAAERVRKAPDRLHQPAPFGFGGPGPNRITEVRFGSGVVRPADEVSSKSWLWLPVTLRIVEDAADPYA
ncbi:hypothetical protein [Novosphingobium aureum]|nr:hypothetical protein [Novosphingobium aureum]